MPASSAAALLNVGSLCFCALLILSCFLISMCSAVYCFAVLKGAREKRDQIFGATIGRFWLSNDEVNKLVAARTKSKQRFLMILRRFDLEPETVEQVSLECYPPSWPNILAVMGEYYRLGYCLIFLHLALAIFSLLMTLSGKSSMTLAAVASYTLCYIAVFVVLFTLESLSRIEEEPRQDSAMPEPLGNSETSFSTVEW